MINSSEIPLKDTQEKSAAPAGSSFFHFMFFFLRVFVLITLCHYFGWRGHTATVTTLSLIKEVNPPRDIMREANMTLSVRLAECMMCVWRQDWCQH